MLCALSYVPSSKSAEGQVLQDFPVQCKWNKYLDVYIFVTHKDRSYFKSKLKLPDGDDN